MAKIERLNNDYSILKQDYDALREELADVRADATLLREQVASLQASSGYEACIAQVENDRLRAEFKRFMDVCAGGTQRGRAMVLIEEADWTRARRALEPKA